MFKIIIKYIALMALSSCIALGAEAVRFNVINGDVEHKFNEMIDKKISKTGFVLNDSKKRINDVYLSRYGDKDKPKYDKDYKTTLDNLGFFSISHDQMLNTLLKKAPELGGFSPFSFLIYKKKGEDKTYVGHIIPSVMLDIVGVKDADVRAEFSASFSILDELVQNRLGGEVEISTYDKLLASTMINFEYEFDREGDISEFIEEFQEKYETAFEDKKYMIAGYKDFKEIYVEAEMDFDEYDAYFVYSLCKFKYSYSIFNKGRPDIGVFAPCSMYLYIKKGSNKVVIGMPKLSNWIAVMNINDEVIKNNIVDIDTEIISILKGFGAKEI